MVYTKARETPNLYAIRSESIRLSPYCDFLVSLFLSKILQMTYQYAYLMGFIKFFMIHTSSVRQISTRKMNAGKKCSPKVILKQYEPIK